MNQFKKFLDLRISFLERELDLGEPIFIGTETYFPKKAYHVDYKTGYIRYLNKDNTDGLDFWFYYNAKTQLNPLHINMVELYCVEEDAGEIELDDIQGIVSDYKKYKPGYDQPVSKPLILGYSVDAELHDVLASKGISLPQ